MTATQRHELQVRTREQEVFEFTLREQVESNRDLLATVQYEDQHSLRTREEAGRELEHTRARAADDAQQLAQEVAEQIDVGDRRTNQATICVLNLREELWETHEECVARERRAEQYRMGYWSEHERVLQGGGIYDNAVGVKDHEFRI